MKYCANCGEQLSDDAVFCPECGQPAPEAAPKNIPSPAPCPDMSVEYAGEALSDGKPRKKKSVGKRIAIIAAIVLGVLLAAAAVLYFTGVYRDLLPAGRTKLGLAEKDLVETVLDDLFRYQPESGDINASVTAKANVETEGSLGMFSDATYIKLFLEQMQIGLDIDYTAEHRNLSAELGYNGSALLSAKLLNDAEQTGFYIPQLDENYYILNNEALVKLISEDENPAFSFTSLDLTPFDEDKTRKEVMELLEAFTVISTNENTKVNSNAAVAIFGGEKAISAVSYTITPSAEEIKTALYAAAEKLEDANSYLGKKLEGYYLLIAEKNETLPAAIRRIADERSGEIAEKNTRIEVYMVGNEIVSQRILSDENNFGYDREETEEGKRIYFFSYEDKASVDSADLRYKDTEGRITGTLVSNSKFEGKSTMTFDLDMNKRTPLGTYVGSLNVTSDENGSVDIVVADDEAHTHTVTIPGSIISEDIRSIVITASVESESGFTPPSADPVDISDKSAEEISEIFSNMARQLTGVLFGGMLGGFGF